MASDAPWHEARVQQPATSFLIDCREAVQSIRVRLSPDMWHVGHRNNTMTAKTANAGEEEMTLLPRVKPMGTASIKKLMSAITTGPAHGYGAKLHNKFLMLTEA